MQIKPIAHNFLESVLSHLEHFIFFYFKTGESAITVEYLASLHVCYNDFLQEMRYVVWPAGS